MSAVKGVFRQIWLEWSFDLLFQEAALKFTVLGEVDVFEAGVVLVE